MWPDVGRLWQPTQHKYSTHAPGSILRVLLECVSLTHVQRPTRRTTCVALSRVFRRRLHNPPPKSDARPHHGMSEFWRTRTLQYCAPTLRQSLLRMPPHATSRATHPTQPASLPPSHSLPPRRPEVHGARDGRRQEPSILLDLVRGGGRSNEKEHSDNKTNSKHVLQAVAPPTPTQPLHV